MQRGVLVTVGTTRFDSLVQLMVTDKAQQPSIAQDIQDATLVVGHAGAGTIFECLKQGKELVVVVNEDLMANHQMELASKVESDGYALACTCTNLLEVLQEVAKANLKALPPGAPEAVISAINDALWLKQTQHRSASRMGLSIPTMVLFVTLLVALLSLAIAYT
eukprot:m.82449 g.82449  ORF g.82449 m.82449 type:complete len:164 (+) comp12690_c0_seq3:35-526(+)